LGWLEIDEVERRKNEFADEIEGEIEGEEGEEDWIEGEDEIEGTD
jgi:hypothetical protein